MEIEICFRVTLIINNLLINMVDNKKDLLAYLVTEFFYAMVGANIYAKEALLDNKFRQLMISKLENLKSNVTLIIGDES